ncbi:ScbR family autoregulator-binding transcription factor [Streptomyces sp. NPDC028635]|uniref:ScbR family autoregulator-binding transcription factor n=1 Tax=Streptomyces sp. NPDC028635 TaxID=3154800 RepID=UPI0033FB201D
MVRQERALRTRQALITSAATVFHRDGFNVASLSEISARAGVSNGALHFHFANKAALAEAVENAAAQRLDELTAVAQLSADNALQLLVNASHGLARRLAEDVVLRAGFQLGADLVRDGCRDLRRQWQEWVERTLKEAAGEGLLNGVSAETVATAVVAATTGFEVLGARDPDWLAPRTLTRFWQLLLPRLAAASVRGQLRAAGAAAKDRGSTAP